MENRIKDKNRKGKSRKHAQADYNNKRLSEMFSRHEKEKINPDDLNISSI